MKNSFYIKVLILGIFIGINGIYLKMNGYLNADYILAVGMTIEILAVFGLLKNFLTKNHPD